MNIKIGLAAFCLLAFVSFKSITASGQGTTVTYKVIDDEPAVFKKLFVNINLLEMDLASPIEWRPGIGAEFTLNKHLYFFAEYDRTLFPFATVYATNKNQSYAEAGTIFSFTSTIKKDRRFKVSFNSGGHRYHMKVKAKAQKQLGVHAGFNEFSTYKQNKDYYAYAHTGSLFAGIALTTTKNMLLSVDGDIMTRCSRSIWYADVMIAPMLTYTDATDYAAYYGSAAQNLPPSGFPKFTKVPFGARMGYMKYKNWLLPLREGFEFGMRPGIGSGLYFALKVDISIGFMKGGNNEPAGKD